jgi:hypothetical protein
MPTTISTSGTYVVQTTGIYKIVAYGGAGGSGITSLLTAGVAGGKGAEYGGFFSLTAGDVLKIIDGGVGGSGTSLLGSGGGGGGGGGTFVIDTSRPDGTYSQTALVEAGGGGGGGANASSGGGAGIAADGSTTPGAAGTGNFGGGGGGYAGGASGTGAGHPATAGSQTFPSTYAGGAGYTNASDSGGYGGGGGGSAGGGGGGGYGGGAGGNASGTFGLHDAGASGGGGSSYINPGSVTTGHVNGVTGENSGAGFVVITAPLCFLRGTRILTPTGEVAVEELRIGDSVVTRFGGIQPVKWIGRHSHAAGDPANTPVCIRAGALGDRTPARDLYVSPGHSMLVDGALVIAGLMVNGATVTQDWCPRRIEYVHIELAAHDCVIAEGAWSETYADAQVSRARFDNAAEFAALYPEHGPAPDDFVLCAPRPERGAALEAAIRPVVARAQVMPGPLQGSIDRIESVWRVQGWAHDPAHPQLPVLLQVELDGRVIGTVAACEERSDLAAAGIGSGRCAFTFTSPVRLRPELLPSLRVRRVADGAEVSMDPRCAAAIGVDVLASPERKPALRLVA